MTLEQTNELIRNSLVGLKLNPEECKGQNPGQWTFILKDSTMWIDVFNFPAAPERWYVQIMSPLLMVPPRNAEALMVDLLELNAKLYSSAICKKDKWFYMISLRETEGMDQKELDALIDRVGIYSSDYFGKLSFKYEGSWDKPTQPTDQGGPKSS